MEIIVTHEMTDFDGLAAAVAAQTLHPGALIVLGRMLGHEVRDYLALHKDRIASRGYEQIVPEAVRHLIVVDVRQKSRLAFFSALVERAERGEIEVSVYDHHPAADDDLRADHLFVERVGSVTTLMVEQMIAKDARIDEPSATLLALGIHADTGSLSYAGTTARDARALGWLLDQGASLRVMSRYLKPPFTPNQRALLVALLGQLEVERIGNLEVAFVHHELRRAFSGFAEVVSELLELTGHAAVFVVLGIAKKRTFVIARSGSPLLDAGAPLRALGGGGHRTAASATLARGDSASVLEQLRTSLRAQPPEARKVSELMTSPVHSVGPGASWADVARSLHSWRHTGVPVLTDGVVVGIVSRSDVERAEAGGRLELPVSSSMSQHVKTIDADASPERALQLMQEHDVGRLPVLRDGRLVGIVTRSDLRRMLYGEA
ncbi:MAG: CBS domain-containing protein [Myxococcales bacterium]|nr:CBS domain-containing protein [Myxococcales bacterium]